MKQPPHGQYDRPMIATATPTSRNVSMLFITICICIIKINLNVVTSFSIRPTSSIGYHHHRRHHPFDDGTILSTLTKTGTLTHTTTTPTTRATVKSPRHDTVRRRMWIIDHELLQTTAFSVDHQDNHNNIIHVWDTYLYFLNHYGVFTQSITAAFFAGMGDLCAQFLSSRQKQQPVDSNNDDTSPLVWEDTTKSVDARPALTSSSYDVQRTMHYVFKGLGGGCMWSVWFSYSDPISLDLTRRLLELYVFLPSSGQTELDYAIVSGDIDVATAASQLLFTHAPLLAVSGCTLQHIIHVVICIVLEQFFVCPLFYTVWDIPIPALLSGSPIRQIPAQIQAKLVPLLIANAKVWTPANIITYSLPSEYRVLFASMTDVIWQTILSDITSNEIILAPPPAIPKTPLLLSSSTEMDSAGVVTATVEHGSRSSTTVAPNSNAAISDSILMPTAATTVSFVSPHLPVPSVGTSSLTAATVFQSTNAVTSNGPE